MKEYLSPDDLASTVILMRDVDTRAILLVEGQSDCAILDGHLDDSVAVTLPGHGKQNVCGAIAALQAQGVTTVAGVVDADFDWLADEVCPGVITTEYYDFDVDLIRCPGVLTRVVGAHFDREAMRSLLEETLEDTVASWLLETASTLGALRLVCRRDGLELSLQKFPIEEVFDVRDLRVDVVRLVELAVQRSDAVVVDPTQLRVLVEAELKAATDPGRLASGHDACAVLALVGRRRLGARGVGREVIERALRSAVGCAEFSTLRVAQDLTRWADGLGVWLWEHHAA